MIKILKKYLGTKKMENYEEETNQKNVVQTRLIEWS